MLKRDGAAALTVRAITDEAGCSTTGIYTHFGGKHGVIEAILLDGFESFDRALLPCYRADDLLGAGRAYRRWALDNPTHYLVMFGRAVPDFVPSAEAVARGHRSFDALIDAVARHGAVDPLAAAYNLYATVHGHVMLELVGMGPVDAGELERLYEAGLAAATIGLDGSSGKAR